jgi:hypothetical protein
MQPSLQPIAARAVDDGAIFKVAAGAAVGKVATWAAAFGSQSFAVQSLEQDRKAPLSKGYQSTAVTEAPRLRDSLCMTRKSGRRSLYCP